MTKALLKNLQEIALMRRSGRIMAEAHALLRDASVPGATTGHLDELFETFVRSRDAFPAFKGYRGFPASICTSINEEIVHGIPSNRRLKSGQILSVDCGVGYQSFLTDAAFTIAVGEVSEEMRDLMAATKECLDLAIRMLGPGLPIVSLSRAVQEHAEKRGFGVVRDFTGHGVGAALWEEPRIPNFCVEPPGQLSSDAERFQAGMTVAIEPMLCAGGYETKTLPNGWTVVTRDGRPSAHFEHTIAITEEGVEVLTALDQEDEIL